MWSLPSHSFSPACLPLVPCMRSPWDMPPPREIITLTTTDSEHIFPPFPPPPPTPPPLQAVHMVILVVTVVGSYIIVIVLFFALRCSIVSLAMSLTQRRGLVFVLYRNVVVVQGLTTLPIILLGEWYRRPLLQVRGLAWETVLSSTHCTVLFCSVYRNACGKIQL